MNLLMVAGSVLGLAGVFLIHAADWTGRRVYRWAWWPVLNVSVFAFLASRASGVAVATAIAVVIIGGALAAVAFTSAATGLGWTATVREYVSRQKRRR